MDPVTGCLIHHIAGREMRSTPNRHVFCAHGGMWSWQGPFCNRLGMVRSSSGNIALVFHVCWRVIWSLAN